jgi:hypothetical protein
MQKGQSARQVANCDFDSPADAGPSCTTVAEPTLVEKAKGKKPRITTYTSLFST